jgi:hypothetical protein
VEHDRSNLDRFEYADHKKCLESLFTKIDKTFVATTFIAQYVAPLISKTADKNQLCCLDENIFSSNSVFSQKTSCN